MANEPKFRLFVDMDGTLNVWQPVDTLEELMQKGFFLNASPYPNMVNMVRAIKRNLPNDVEVFILSTCVDSPYAKTEKREWLDREGLFTPDNDHILFCPDGTTKAEYAEHYLGRSLTKQDILLDDYSINLHQWEKAGGKGIKALNGVNGTGGTWGGAVLSNTNGPGTLMSQLIAIASGQPLPTQKYFVHMEYGWDGSESGDMCHAFILKDLDETSKHSEIMKALAEMLCLEPDACDLGWGHMDVQLPQTLVDKIKADGVKEFLCNPKH